MASNPKNKDTLFFPTDKIVENKVPLFFGLEIKWMGYGRVLGLISEGVYEALLKKCATG